MENRKIRVGITHGDINGVGYEVILKTFSDPTMLELCTPVVYGSPKVAAYHRKAMEIQTSFSIVNSAEEVQDRSRDRDSGRLIAPVVESGKGYQWKKSAIYKTKQARPFHQKAQELAIGTGLVRDALAKSLTESGFKVKE